MSIITMPTNLAIGAFAIGQARFDTEEVSDSTGHSSARLLGPPRWTISMGSPQNITVENATVWEALLLRLRGRVNHLSAWDVMRPVPRGTMRGTMTLSGSHAAGAVLIAIAAGAGEGNKTLLAGDWLQIGAGVGTSQLVKVVVGGTADSGGTIQVTVEPPLRIAHGGAASVTWDKPVAYYKTRGDTAGWRYVARDLQSGFGFDGIEQWSL